MCDYPQQHIRSVAGIWNLAGQHFADRHPKPTKNCTAVVCLSWTGEPRTGRSTPDGASLGQSRGRLRLPAWNSAPCCRFFQFGSGQQLPGLGPVPKLAHIHLQTSVNLEALQHFWPNTTISNSRVAVQVLAQRAAAPSLLGDIQQSEMAGRTLVTGRPSFPPPGISSYTHTFRRLNSIKAGTEDCTVDISEEQQPPHPLSITSLGEERYRAEGLWQLSLEVTGLWPHLLEPTQGRAIWWYDKRSR